MVDVSERGWFRQPDGSEDPFWAALKQRCRKVFEVRSGNEVLVSYRLLRNACVDGNRRIFERHASAATDSSVYALMCVVAGAGCAQDDALVGLHQLLFADRRPHRPLLLRLPPVRLTYCLQRKLASFHNHLAAMALAYTHLHVCYVRVLC